MFEQHSLFEDFPASDRFLQKPYFSWLCMRHDDSEKVLNWLLSHEIHLRHTVVLGEVA